MSRQMIQLAKAMDCDKPTQRFVAFILADSHNAETGKCNPSVAHIMAMTGFSNRPISKAIADLSEAGHLTVDRKFGSRSGYILHFKTSDAGSRQPVTQGHGSDDGTDDAESLPPVTLKTPTSDPNAKTGDPASRNREIGDDKEEKGRGKKVSSKELALQEIAEASQVTLDALASPELKALWQEWQHYRFRMATAPASGQKKVHWTAQAANIAAKNMQAWNDKHGIQAVTTSVQRAIETAGKWITFFEPTQQSQFSRSGTKPNQIKAIDTENIVQFSPQRDIAPF